MKQIKNNMEYIYIYIFLIFKIKIILHSNYFLFKKNEISPLFIIKIFKLYKYFFILCYSI